MEMLLADAWVSLCGAFGALIVLLRLSHLIAAPGLAWRFRTCLLVIIALMTFRVGHWAEWGWTFSAITYATAALLPLTALLLAEGMMRQHAPKALKRYCGWGAFSLVLLALRPAGWMEFAHVLSLLLFQLSALGWVAVMVIHRDRSLLSEAENQALTRVLLSFLLILPFLATDFLSPVIPVLPVRLGGIAVLGLCLLAININRTGLSQRRIIGSMAALWGASTLLTLVIARLTAPSLQLTLQIGTIILSMIMVLAIWQAVRALMVEDRNQIILREIALAPTAGQKSAMRLIQKGAEVGDTLRLEESDLADFDVTNLKRLFEQSPVRCVATDHRDEQLAWLFKKYEASHALCISTAPLVIIAFNNPALMASDDAGYGLRALQRVAAQIAASEAPC